MQSDSASATNPRRLRSMASMNFAGTNSTQFPQIQPLVPARSPLSSNTHKSRRGGKLSTRTSFLMTLRALTGFSWGGLPDEKLPTRETKPIVAVLRCRLKLGWVRLMVFALFVFLYFWSLTLSNDSERSAPVAEQARKRFLPEVEESIEDMIEQQFTKSLVEFMPGPDIAQSLNSIQSRCRDAALQSSDQSSANFKCEIIKIEVNSLHGAPSPHIPCTDPHFIHEAFIAGDYAPYNKIPTVLSQIYQENNVSRSDRFVPSYTIGEGYPFFQPLFNTESDVEARVGLGPLPLLDRKINELARRLGVAGQGSLFRSSSLGFGQSSGIARQPPLPSADFTPRRVDRNHHWDLLFYCEPVVVSVSLRIWTTRSDMPMWWRFRFSFTSTGKNLNFYRAKLHVKTGITSFTKFTKWHLLVPGAALFLYLFCFCLPATLTILSLPYGVYKLMMRQGSFKRTVTDLVDPLHVRVLYTPRLQLLTENLGAVLSLIGFGCSIAVIFSSKYYTGFFDSSLGRNVSPWTFWTENLDLNACELASQVLFGLWSCGGWHAAAAVMYLLRLLEFSTKFDGTSFILMTFVFALFPVLHFCFIFCVLLLAFAVVLYSIYGRIFTQYSSLTRCLWNIMLYTFSFGEASKTEYMIDPQIEDSAVSLQYVLLAFQIIVVIIFLNMFTTIVIDAYNVACDRASSAAKMKCLEAALWYRAKMHFGYTHEVDEEIEILGGQPGSIFLRATVLDDDLLEEGTPEPAEVIKKIEELMEMVKPLLNEGSSAQASAFEKLEAMPPLKSMRFSTAFDDIPENLNEDENDIASSSSENEATTPKIIVSQHGDLSSQETQTLLHKRR